MKAFKKKPRLTRTQSLKSVPVKNKEVEEVRLDSGDIMLIYPVAVKPWAAVLLRKLGKPPENIGQKKIQLDALGTFVWKLLDDRRTVNHIIEIFTHKQQVHRKEAEVAVTQFLRELGKRNLIGIK
jgi:hypothetical protein